MVFLYDIILALSSFVFAAAITGVAYIILKKLQVMDMPNERSNHTAPVPRGGGIGIAFALMCFLTTSGAASPLLLSALGLGIISFMDDIKHGVPIATRFFLQAAAVLWVLSELHHVRLMPALPYLAEMAILAVAWLWFINLFNFMDGIDGLAASEAVIIGLGITIIATLTTVNYHLGLVGLIIAGTSAGFLIWNWHPAKVFMGDVGSITLGFFIGFFLLSLAVNHQPIAALILPAYFITDATLTLILRILRGKAFWKAHSSHAYQRAVRSGLSHSAVTGRVFVLNLLLIGLAVASTTNALYAEYTLITAYTLSFLLVVLFWIKSPKIAGFTEVSEGT